MRIGNFEGDSNPFFLIIDQVIITIRGKFNCRECMDDESES